MSARDRETETAIRICRAAALDPEYMNGCYYQAAIRLGYQIKLVRGEPGCWRADYEGRDARAVELASAAWLSVDPEPLGITSPLDGRRDEAAAKLLEEGYTDE